MCGDFGRVVGGRMTGEAVLLLLGSAAAALDDDDDDVSRGVVAGPGGSGGARLTGGMITATHELLTV